MILLQLVVVNLVLGVFNLIPIPPLDGSRIVMGILPRQAAYRYATIERFGFYIVIILIWLGAFDILVWPCVNFFLRLFKVAY
jgi:Zn-dependent protease